MRRRGGRGAGGARPADTAADSRVRADFAEQANMTPERALDLWPQLEATGAAARQPRPWFSLPTPDDGSQGTGLYRDPATPTAAGEAYRSA